MSPTSWLDPVTGASASDLTEGTSVGTRVTCPGLLATVVSDQNAYWWVFGGTATTIVRYLRQRQSPRSNAPRMSWLHAAALIRQRQTYL